VKYPYNINASTQQIALEALSKPIDGQVKEIVSERERVSSILPGFKCVQKVYPSQANFILVKVDDAKDIYFRLLDAGVIVRDRSNVKGCENCLRITIGLPEENDKLIEVFKNYQ